MQALLLGREHILMNGIDGREALRESTKRRDIEDRII